MDKIVKNFQWIIVLFGLYNLFNIYQENEGKPGEIRKQGEGIKTQLEKNKKLKNEMEDFYKNAEEAKLKIQKVKESIEKTQQLLPSEISDSENLDLLRKTGEILNIKLMNINPGPEEVRGLFIAKQYTFEAKATYMQFIIFFEKIASNKRVLNIKNVSFKKLETPQKGKFTLIQGKFVLEAYKFNANFKEQPEPVAAPAPAGAPAKAPRKIKKKIEAEG
jgi:Tfp pilus assembly protein PilO